jgi:hypothetical protein
MWNGAGLGQRGVEGAVSERKPLGNPEMHADLRETVADRSHERGGRIDCCNAAAAWPVHESCGQSPWPAADVKHPLTSVHTGQVRELHGQRLGETTHEPGVGICRDVKDHDARLGGYAGGPTSTCPRLAEGQYACRRYSRSGLGQSRLSTRCTSPQGTLRAS